MRRRRPRPTATCPHCGEPVAACELTGLITTTSRAGLVVTAAGCVHCNGHARHAEALEPEYVEALEPLEPEQAETETEAETEAEPHRKFVLWRALDRVLGRAA